MGILTSTERVKHYNKEPMIVCDAQRCLLEKYNLFQEHALVSIGVFFWGGYAYDKDKNFSKIMTPFCIFIDD